MSSTPQRSPRRLPEHPDLRHLKDQADDPRPNQFPDSYNRQRARERPMRKRPRPDQIAAILRDFQADLDDGLNVNHACRKAGIGPTTHYRWKVLQDDPI